MNLFLRISFREEKKIIQTLIIEHYICSIIYIERIKYMLYNL